ncbi:MAG TPA: hypothetical protein DD438_00590 [Verrucomicrobiales bacterium]|nr:hypothetical protein [Verrucomicrobiales bacterium]
MHPLVGGLPWGHVAIKDHIINRERAFFDVPVAYEMKGAILPGAVTTSAILVNQGGNVLVERYFGRAGEQRPEEQ